MNAKTIGFACAIVAAFALGLYLSLNSNFQGNDVDVPGFLWPDPPQIGEFSLDRSDGTTFNAEDMRGRWTLVFFGFANCPDICPTTMNTLKTVSDNLHARSGSKIDVQTLFVSVDPSRDTPEILDAYVKYFDPEFIGATADESRLKKFSKQFGALFMKVNTGPADSYTMDHSASILFVDPALRFVGLFSPPHDAADIEHRMREIVKYLQTE